MKATLVVMAAGLGSRYGGEKQIDGIGPHGEALMEYSIYDAIAAGFHKIVFIIKPHMQDTLEKLCGERIRGMTTPDGTSVEVVYAVQDFHSVPNFYAVPADRVKPFGTVHAALCAKDVVTEPFALINADDFYGRSAYETVYAALEQLQDTGEATMVSYRLKNTVSENGTVTRGVCFQENGALARIQETYKIKKCADGRICDTENPDDEKTLDPETLVSMNFWGFTPWIFTELEQFFDTFLKTLSPDELKAECLLPEMVDQLIHQGKLKVSVLSTDAVWFGVTYREDKETVARELKKLHHSGAYPASLRK